MAAFLQFIPQTFGSRWAAINLLMHEMWHICQDTFGLQILPWMQFVFGFGNISCKTWNISCASHMLEWPTAFSTFTTSTWVIHFQSRQAFVTKVKWSLNRFWWYTCSFLKQLYQYSAHKSSSPWCSMTRSYMKASR